MRKNYGGGVRLGSVYRIAKKAAQATVRRSKRYANRGSKKSTVWVIVAVLVAAGIFFRKKIMAMIQKNRDGSQPE